MTTATINDFATGNTTATQTYDHWSRHIQYLLGYLDGTLERHQQKAQADSKNWSYAADLNRTRDQLIDLVADLSGRSRESLRDSLYEHVA